MTPEQHARYQAAMITGYTSGVGGSSWTYYPAATGNRITTTPTLTSSGTIEGYVVQERLSQYGQPQPPEPVGSFQWRFVGPTSTTIATGAIIKSVADTTLVFSIGPVDTYQGFPTAICTPTTG